MKDRRAAIFAVWDEGSAGYVPAEGDRCVALWASSALNRSGEVDHATDDICGRLATDKAADTPLCDHHFERALHWLRELMGAEAQERAAHHREALEIEWERARSLRPDLDRREAELDARQRQLEAREFKLRTERAATGLVYYLRRTDGLIKIGATRRLTSRLSRLRLEHGDLQILLTHSGYLDREHELHGQFAHLRMEGEWFRPEADLVAWIISQREDPDCQLPPDAVPISEVTRIQMDGTAA